MKKGIDISKWNSITDLKSAAKAGIEFVIIRAGAGTEIDSQFETNYNNAKAAGLDIGVYWFCYAKNEAEAKNEAALCISALENKNISLPVFYDFETDTEKYASKAGISYTKTLRTSIISAFCEKIEISGLKAGVYTNPDYINYKLNYGNLSKYPLWLALWRSNNALSFEEVDADSVTEKYGKPLMWQFGFGIVPGCGNYTDMNYGYYNTPDSGNIEEGKTNIPTDSNSVEAVIKAGDSVKVKNTFELNGKTLARLYGGGYFIVYKSIYTVIQVVKDRAVIGYDGLAIAALAVSELEKL